MKIRKLTLVKKWTSVLCIYYSDILAYFQNARFIIYQAVLLGAKARNLRGTQIRKLPELR